MISLVVIVLTFGALFIPQSFVNFINNAERSYSGIEVFFNFNYVIGNNTANWMSNNLHGRVMASGIILLVLLALGATCFIFHKKSSSLVLFGGILNVLASIVLFAMELWMLIVYPQKAPVVLWVAYVFGAFLLITGGLSIYAAIVALKKEKVEAYSKKSYSYLKNK